METPNPSPATDSPSRAIPYAEFKAAALLVLQKKFQALLGDED